MKKGISTGLMLGVALCVVLAGVVWATPESMIIVSDTNTMVSGPLASYAPPGDSTWPAANPAVATWVHGSWPWKTDPDGATWISASYYIGEPIATSSWRWFQRTFELCPGAYNMAGSIDVTSDNAEDVYLNGALVGQDGEVQDPWQDNYEWGTVLTYDLTDALQPGTNTLDLIVRNYPGSSSPTANPTGLIYKAMITYDCGPIPVQIDIKPGSYPNCFNINGHGVVPVAIMGSADFDVTEIDISSLSFAGLEVRVKGNDKPQCSFEDVSGDFTYPEGAPDGWVDLVCQFVDDSTAWEPGDTTATLTGNLIDGTPIEGSDEICIVP